MSDKGGTIVALSPVDNRMIPCCDKLLFYFSMLLEVKGFETYEILCKGFHIAVADMTICGGITRLRPRDRSERHIPLHFKDLTGEISYGRTSSERFSYSSNQTQSSITKFNADVVAGIQTTAAQTNFVKGGCLLRLVMWHHTIYPYRAYVFARTWMSHYKKLQTEQGREDKWQQRRAAGKISPRDDRQVLESIWRKEGSSETSAFSDR
ncbi:hypothetical protein HD806DRAFT_531767 [Xylariaceae sp. AK1471]|nr:hypothetical protein HD806DRAFT_531767 [Xylariaceae sp. AK1471]